MNTIEEVLEAWHQDSKISGNNLTEISRETPSLHAKYLSVLTKTKLKLKKAEMDQKTLLKKKWLYYNGKMTQEEMNVEGWEYDPLNGLKVMKGEMDYYYNADEDIQNSELKIQYLKTMIHTLTDIVDMLKWRHQTIGNMIKWQVFEAGG